ncbi:MAG: hypothetical protein VKO00_02655 [Cyanobacteriota bacterium]|nr:hypothetical protein [Cyanobacteriota bacterium]
MRRRLMLALLPPLALVLVQQQLLLRLPPRLEALEAAAASAGPAALRARFSRPMRREEVAAASRLSPTLPHRWLGEGDTLSLSLTGQGAVRGPVALRIGGRDQRGQALAVRPWVWDPRGRVLAVVPSAGGERLELRDHSGRWWPISPTWPRVMAIEPLGDGGGVAVVSADASGLQQAWRIGLRQWNLAPPAQASRRPEAGAPQRLGADGRLFVHLSSDRSGQLLVQSGGARPGSERTELWPRRGLPSRLALRAGGPLRLLPEGGAVVVPEAEGLSLRTLPPRPAGRQVLPGSRDLSSFCPQAGRALLLRHWPDYRRSLELVEPGLPPRQLWIGSQAALASACERGGQRVWVLLAEASGEPRLTLLALDRLGRLLGRRELRGWQLEPDTGLAFDPGSASLLTSLRRQSRGPRGDGEAVLIDADSLELRGLGRPVLQTAWLPPG